MCKANHTLNADMTQQVRVNMSQLEWQASSSDTVWRKRLHLAGELEAPQITSIVRYEKNATFPHHAHQDGAEIFVLEGIFSDEHGHWPAGTYLLNPEGFQHAPFSHEGCLLFVKLRQYAGAKRHSVALPTPFLPWEPSPQSGISTKILYNHPGFEDHMQLEQWQAGVQFSGIAQGGMEILVLEGALSDGQQCYSTLSWLRFPINAPYHLSTPNGCTIYTKRGAMTSLISVPSLLCYS